MSLLAILFLLNAQVSADLPQQTDIKKLRAEVFSNVKKWSDLSGYSETDPKVHAKHYNAQTRSG